MWKRCAFLSARSSFRQCLRPQIYFASRTHSQLSQFVAELRKTSFSRATGTSVETGVTSQPASSPAPSSDSTRPIRLIPLGSRQALCINDEVRRKSGGSNDAMGDLCTELQKGGKDRCPHLPPLTEPGLMNDFRDKALVRLPCRRAFSSRSRF
jgi:chromosome transmission fidelity protein 1